MKIIKLLSSTFGEDFKINKGLNILGFKPTYIESIEVKKNIFEKSFDFFKKILKKNIKSKCIQIEKEEDLALETKSSILNEILDYIFKKNESTPNGKKMFDFYLDYRYYYYDFRKLGIDLLRDDISWLEFDMILEGILLQKEGAMLQVLEYRNYKKPTGNMKTYQNEEHQYYMSKQRQYALPVERENIDNGFDKMWDYLEEQTKTKK